MSLLWERDCVSCPITSSTCDPVCGANEVCSLVANSCTQCGGPKCVSTGGGGQKSNSGAIAGGVVAALVAVLIGLGYLWYRRRRMQLAIAAQRRVHIEAKPDIVASAATVLNRPDPLEKPPSTPSSSKFNHNSHDNGDGHSSVFGVDPSSIHLDQMSMSLRQPDNPFSDHASIATASDRATNVIPIGLIDPSSASIALSHGSGPSSGSTPGSISTAFTAPTHSSLSPPGTPRGGGVGPLRPQRAGPELDMRLDLARPNSEASSVLLPPKAPYAKSSRSGLSGVSSRASTISTSSSFLNEAPQIVTPKQANFRQVLGVQRAEVVKLGSTPPSPAGSIKSHASTSTLGKSPLGQVSEEVDQPSPSSITSGNPFSDRSFAPSPSPSSPGGDWSSSRPTSTMSAAESIANISTVQRIQVVKPLAPRVAEARQLLAPPSPGTASYTQTHSSPHSSPSSTPRATDFRSAGQLSPRNGEFRTAGQLSPPAQAIPRSFDDVMDHRMSGSSLALTNRTSTTDSILEAFPFVPPSPISLVANQSTGGGTTPRTPRTFQQQQEAALQYQQHQGHEQGDDISEAPTPRPGRMTLGMSTMSSASSGLGSYAFQIDGAVPPPPGLERHAMQRGEERASLDTIQLSRDLAQFPLPGDSPTNLKNL